MSKKIVLDFFETALLREGNSPRAVGWSPDSQKRRFDVLLSLDDLNHKTILDFGCGLGHFRSHILHRFPNSRYIGVDIAEKMIAAAKNSEKEGDFRCLDILTHPLEEPVDFIIANGIDNVETGQNEEFVRVFMPKLFHACREGLKVTMLSTWTGKRDPKSHYFDPLQILQYARALSAHIVFRHDYAPNDFSLFLYKHPKGFRA